VVLQQRTVDKTAQLIVYDRRGVEEAICSFSYRISVADRACTFTTWNAMESRGSLRYPYKREAAVIRAHFL